MAKTAEMRLVELMVLKQDINSVIEYIGKKGSFQFQTRNTDDTKGSKKAPEKIANIDEQFYSSLKNMCAYLNISVQTENLDQAKAPTDQEKADTSKLIAAFNDLQKRCEEASEELEKVIDAQKETQAFANLKVSYSELEHLSFLSLRIGRIDPAVFEDLKASLSGETVVVALGEDKSFVMTATSKKNRSDVDAQLKSFGFTEVPIPENFTGVPDNVLEGLGKRRKDAEALVEEMKVERDNFAETHEEKILELLKSYAIGVQISNVVKNLESTELVYRVTGWVPEAESQTYMKELDEITQGRVAVRLYNPLEVPGVISGKEKVPVKLTHGKVMKSFERIIFSYGAPMYGTIDPTPFVAIFFTILFGIMFGDLGQGLVFVLVGILMALKVLKVGGWEKFAPVFISIGVTSSIMGLLTGEVFSNETLLEPFAEWVTGLFGTPHAPILKMMPSSDPNSIKVMFGVFGIAVGIGFIINTIGLIINIINNIILKRYDEAFFGKNGLAGAVFFWYVIATVIRIVVFKTGFFVFDWIILGISLFFAAFAEPFENLVAGRRPILENGVGTYIISGIVEIIEVISGYLSNTVSFVRVGAFALSHAVLDYVILILTEMCGGPASIAGIFVLIIGNAVIIVLEGMIVTIQVIRLQYYEFFSKFFHENGKEFAPFKFDIN